MSVRELRRSQLALGVALLLAVTALRFANSGLGEGFSFLYVLPILVFAVEFGRRGGLAAAGAAIALFTAWAAVTDSSAGLTAHLTRGAVFVCVGMLAGTLAGRLRLALASAEAGALHFELSRDMLCTQTLDGRFLDVNGAWEETLGWPRDALIGRRLSEFVHPGDVARSESEVARAARGGSASTWTSRVRGRDGAWRWIEWSSRADAARGLLFATARDVTERHLAEAARRAYEDHLRELADQDPLTGVFNRRRFDAELRRELEQPGRQGAVCIVDLDDFKAVNDVLGHETGDHVIRQVAHALVERVRRDDVVSRLGGDEFALLLPGAGAEAATVLAADLVRCIDAAIDVALPDGRRPGASVGVALYGPALPADPEAILRAADAAMYAAKARGGRVAALAT